ncbi:type II CAAX endopeptidase family protein [uncultured Tenacibaculum sp.]|uniref:CPBP family intramembrane glutamic endopeptidase n=1 Tax=uncultured Tenacibaculum sp. TaxID=174713 RepID=UPI0026344F02|nr:type II CAAX endopeptidase family protein [uncultured Tenacibaculum sp.]
MKTKIYTQLSKSYIVILVMIIAPFLGYFDRNFSYFFGLTIAGLLLWSSQYHWSLFGFGKKINKRTIVRGIIYASILYAIFIPIDSIIESYLGKANLSSLAGIEGNFINYIITLIVIWIFAAFGEEFLFRGFYLKGLVSLFGNTKKAWYLGIVIVSLYFSVSHIYQGITGVVQIFPLALIYSIIFYKNKENLSLLVIMHGFHDTIALTLLYLGLYR